MLSSEGVASKRNFFEASAPSKAEPLAVRKVRAGAGLSEDLPVPGQAPTFWTNLPLFGYRRTARYDVAWMQFGGSLAVVERCQAGLGSGTGCHRNSGSVWVRADALVFEELGWSQGVGWSLPVAGLLSLPVH